MDNKFEKVVNDIIEMLANKKYEDKEMEIIKANILLNLYQLTKSEKTFEKGVQVLKIAREQ